MKTVTGVIAIGLMAFVSAIQAASPPASLVMIPPQINYQGRLVTPTNSPYADAVHTIDLTLYPAASGGTKLWSERYSVQTRDGYFSVNLGSGGTGLLATNLSLYQVLWKDTSDASSPDTYFMALTVRTDQNGNPLSTPTEATPRQQFLTAPFAYRAHQSVYATRADGVFDAPEGVQTPALTTTNNTMSIAAPNMAITGTSMLSIVSRGVLAQVSSNAMVIGSSGDYLGLSGTSVRISTTATSSSLLVNGKPMFVMISASTSSAVGAQTYYISHGLSTTDYDVMVVGFSTGNLNNGVRSVNMPSTSYSYATLSLASAATVAGQSIVVRFLGIRKGLMVNY